MKAVEKVKSDMEFTWKQFTFCVENGRVYLKKFGKATENRTHSPFVELQLAGRDHYGNVAEKPVRCSETETLGYVSHVAEEKRLTVMQANELCEVTTVLQAFDDCNAVQIFTKVRNVSEEPVTVETLSACEFGGLFGGRANVGKTYFTKFTQGHHCECQPRRFSLEEYGFNAYADGGEKCLTRKNVGSWSTKEELSQGILEYDNHFLMFEIESNNHWQYTISAQKGELVLYLGGESAFCGNESKELLPNESLRTVSVALACGNSLNAVIGEMTKYRRHIAGRCAPDKHLPVIFNEYMHLSWDSPTEENTRKVAPTVANSGAEYYVIDCGWHNEEAGNIVYPYVGQWRESKARFPHGVRATTDFIRSLGMKAGLWIEPEIVGVKCEEMLNFYDEDCFLHRNGKRIAVMGRYFLNFSAPKVIDYLSETIRRMVEEYGAQYIKMDYNEDAGGADESLSRDRAAYLAWIDKMRRRFPNVLFETCSSGGMRMDYETLKHFSLVSTSDQTDYRLYPYISANILSAVLPEQAAVWNYPVVGEDAIGEPFLHDKKWAKENISFEQIVMNTVNALLGRMHLASHLEILTGEQFALVQEGIEYYNRLTPVKKTALPYLPLGFTKFGASYAACGLKADNKLYLAVWNLDTEKEICIPVPEKIRTVKVGYPRSLETDFSFTQTALIVRFKNRYTARFLEIETEK